METDRLILRNWENRDAEAFHRLNHDEQVMRFFATRRTRAEADDLMARTQEHYRKDGFGFAAVEEKASGHCIGLCGLARFPDGIDAGNIRLEIGWRLLPEAQGQGYATEAAHAWLKHGFETLDEPGICAFAVPDNTASVAVMKRIGMGELANSPFNHPNVPQSHPHLMRHVLFGIKKTAWTAQTGP